MRIYSLYLSEDGLHPRCFTNAKVLFGALNTVYENASEIQFYNRFTEKFEYIKFNYSNILKAIKLNSGIDNRYFIQFDVMCKDGARMQVKELQIITK